MAGEDTGDESISKVVNEIPEVASLPETETVTGLIHQPLSPLVPVKLKSSVGGTVSIFNDADPIALVSPQEECAQ
jgi:hypothetical protein